VSTDRAGYDGSVTEPSPAPTQGPSDGPSTPRQPGERRLPHPPSDRYRTPESEARVVDVRASAARGIAYALVVAAVGSASMMLLGGVLAVSAGLLVVAGVTGWAVAAALRAGAGSGLDRIRLGRSALGLATLSVAGGQLGLWLYARSEGGVLGPLDYLAETFGFLVPLEFLVAWVVAWATAR
jgi:hypothetical protein